jgi:hypothetical protein
MPTGRTAPYEWYQKHRDGELTDQQVIEGCIAYGERLATGINTARWISHILNRLGFERSELGEIPKFEGEITAVILQAFARDSGAHKPKAKLIDGIWELSSSVPLPAHISDGTSLKMDADNWCDLIQSVGYEVVIKQRRPSKKQTCSLINPTAEQAQKLQELWNLYSEGTKYGTKSETLEMNQAIYSANSRGDYSKCSTISINSDGCRIWSSLSENNETLCRVRIGSGCGLYSTDRVITLIDKPQKEIPIDLDALIAEAKKQSGEK